MITIMPDPTLIIDPSHSMRRFSDIPWGCWSCGACDCHHKEKLRLPCDKGIKRKDDANAK